MINVVRSDVVVENLVWIKEFKENPVAIIDRVGPQTLEFPFQGVGF